jgi:hypothetical protein
VKHRPLRPSVGFLYIRRFQRRNVRLVPRLNPRALAGIATDIAVFQMAKAQGVRKQRKEDLAREMESKQK